MHLCNDNEAQEILKVSARTLRRWRQQGLIPFYVLPGGAIRYGIENLNHWIQQGCPKPRTAATIIRTPMG